MHRTVGSRRAKPRTTCLYDDDEACFVLSQDPRCRDRVAGRWRWLVRRARWWGASGAPEHAPEAPGPLPLRSAVVRWPGGLPVFESRKADEKNRFWREGEGGPRYGSVRCGGGGDGVEARATSTAARASSPRNEHIWASSSWTAGLLCCGGA
eukprot:scaffold10059_cov123-Isochrysis_galbana.AAC.8